MWGKAQLFPYLHSPTWSGKLNSLITPNNSLFRFTTDPAFPEQNVRRLSG
jgi:hypothetical protein